MENIDLERWYRPKIDKTEFRKLCKKSDWQGFKHMIIFFVKKEPRRALSFFPNNNISIVFYF